VIQNAHADPHQHQKLTSSHSLPCLPCLIDMRYHDREISSSHHHYHHELIGVMLTERQTRRPITSLRRPWRTNSAQQRRTKNKGLYHWRTSGRCHCGIINIMLISRRSKVGLYRELMTSTKLRR